MKHVMQRDDFLDSRSFLCSLREQRPEAFELHRHVAATPGWLSFSRIQEPRTARQRTALYGKKRQRVPSKPDAGRTVQSPTLPGSGGCAGVV